ncbi:MAG: ERCC4 domain-containing protein [Lentisphaeria bacterium]
MESTKSKATVIADDRERKSDTFLYLSNLEKDIELRIGHLRIGDYRVSEGLVFERKTLSDFIQSIKDGRLFRQAERLASIPDHRGVLILEGTTASLSKTRMSREAIQGALISLTLTFNIPVLRAFNGEESAKLILTAVRQTKRKSENYIPRSSSRIRGKKAAQIYLLQGLPGIGRQKASDLLHHFQTFNGVINADLEELQQVKGIGKETAEKIIWAVSENTGIYNFYEG